MEKAAVAVTDPGDFTGCMFSISETEGRETAVSEPSPAHDAPPCG